MAVVALVSWPSAPLTESLVRRSLNDLESPPIVTSSPPNSFSVLLQWSTYDSICHEFTHSNPRNVLSSSYIIRKALIRKHFLSRCIHSYLTKNKQSPLKHAIPQTWDLEISHADELDEMWCDELWDLGEELENSTKWYILKPGMADRGMGIRLFNSKESLQHVFEEFEDVSDNEATQANDTAVMISQLRHFVIQEYLSTPLLVDPTQVQFGAQPSAKGPESLNGHKFHLRAYVVASGALTLYLYPRILALFSALPYSSPIVHTLQDGTPLPLDLTPHLTNTSLQTLRGEEGVRLLDELVGCHILSSYNAVKNHTAEGVILTLDDIVAVQDQIAEVLSETFKAALETPVHFQPLPNAFELYGVDFLVSQIHTPSYNSNNTHAISRPSFQVQLLEINSEPAIELTGPRLNWILEDLFLSIGKVCVTPFFTKEQQQHEDVKISNWAVGETRHGLRKCLEVVVRGST